MVNWKEIFHVDISNILPIILSGLFIFTILITIIIIIEVNTK